MTDDPGHDDLPDDTIRDALASAGERPTSEFVASLRSILADTAAGRRTAPVVPPDQRASRWRPLLAAAAVIALVVAAVAALATRGDDGDIATIPPTEAPVEPAPTAGTTDHPTTAEQLTEWVGIRLNGVGNGAVNGRYPWFVITSIDGETGAIRMAGNDGCNDWSSWGTIVDGRYVEDEGESDGEDCGPGTFAPFGSVAFIVRDDGIDIERDGIVYPFGPDPVVADAATLIDRRQFVATSPEAPFPMIVSVDGPDVVGFDGCGYFGATAEYSDRFVVLVDIESSCSTNVSPIEGDVVEIVDDTTVHLRRGADTVASLTAVNRLLRPPSADWLLGEWLLGSGRATFADGPVTFGRCATTWASVDGFVVLEPLADDCVTGLFPDDPWLEDWLHQRLEGPFTVRSLPPATGTGRVALLQSGPHGLRLDEPPTVPALLDELVGRTWVGVDGPWRTTSPTLGFDSLNREPGLLGVVIDTGCNRGGGTFRLDGARMLASEVIVEAAGCEHEVAYLVDGTTLAVDDGVLTVISTSGPTITTTYVALDSLEAVHSPDLAGDWLANGTPLTIQGTSVTASDDPYRLADLVETALADEPSEAFRHGDGWLVQLPRGSVRLEPR